MKRDFIPQRRSKIDIWEQNFIKSLSHYASNLGIDPGQLSALSDQINTHRQVYREAQEIKTTAKSKVKQMQDEQQRTVRAIRKIVRQIKASSTYTDEMGKSMGIIGAENQTELTNPVLKVTLDINQPVIRFRKKHSQGVFIYCKRGDEKELTLLGFATRSPYVDKRPNLDPTKPEERHYAAYYMKNDQPTGLISAEVVVTLTRN